MNFYFAKHFGIIFLKLKVFKQQIEKILYVLCMKKFAGSSFNCV